MSETSSDPQISRWKDPDAPDHDDDASHPAGRIELNRASRLIARANALAGLAIAGAITMGLVSQGSCSTIGPTA